MSKELERVEGAFVAVLGKLDIEMGLSKNPQTQWGEQYVKFAVTEAQVSAMREIAVQLVRLSDLVEESLTVRRGEARMEMPAELERRRVA